MPDHACEDITRKTDPDLASERVDSPDRPAERPVATEPVDGVVDRGGGGEGG